MSSPTTEGQIPTNAQQHPIESHETDEITERVEGISIEPTQSKDEDDAISDEGKHTAKVQEEGEQASAEPKAVRVQVSMAEAQQADKEVAPQAVEDEAQEQQLEDDLKAERSDADTNEEAPPPPLPEKKDAPTSPVKGRESLADPAVVAAVAQAFGRGSPSLSDSKPTSCAGVTLAQKDLPSFPPESEPAATCMPDQVPAPQATASQEASAPSEETASKAAEPSSSSSSPVAEARRFSASSVNAGKGPPPTTPASEERPFDFNRFLEQMKHRTAQPVGEYVRSFIKGFAKKPYRTNDQIKLIFDFLAFISERMRECDIWASLNEMAFENAKEAMEKLVMNRLYPYTFTPAVQKEGRWNVQTDDLERDRVLKQRIRLFGWLKEKHLDVPVGDHSRGFVEFSVQELLKINHYKAPRDKLICILNCCKVIFGMIRHLSSEENADTFIPVLIFVVLKANPDNLISNVEYISRFRNPDRLSSESGYYLSSLMGAISFIETMDYTSLSNITQEEFEKNVEHAVQTMPEPESPVIQSEATLTPPRANTPSMLAAPRHNRSTSANSVTSPSAPGEENAKALPSTPMAASLAEDTRAFFLRTGEAARVGFGRPMGALGRLINEGIEGIRTPNSGTDSQGYSIPTSDAAPSGSNMTPLTSRSRLFAGLFGPDASPSQSAAANRRSIIHNEEPQTPMVDTATSAPNAPLRPRAQRAYSDDQETPNARLCNPAYKEDSPSRLHPCPLDAEQQAVQESIELAQEAQQNAGVETLKSIFPGMEEGVIVMVLQGCEGNVEVAIDRLLEMT